MAIRPDQRHDRDRREPRRRLRHRPRGRRQFAARSHQRAAAAWAGRALRRRDGAVRCRSGAANRWNSTDDEGIRPDTTPETLGRLRTVMTGRHRHRRQLQPAERRRRGVSGGGRGPARRTRPGAARLPGRLGGGRLRAVAAWASGPVAAVEKLFRRTGLGFDEMDLIEINEAFAVQVLAVLAGLGRQARGRRRQAQRQRLRHLARAPHRSDRRADPGHHAARAAPAGRRSGAGDHVHRRRAGRGRGLPRGLLMKGLVGYASYLPRYRLAGGDIGLRRGDRVVAAFDEDSTTMAVAAGELAPLIGRRRPVLRDQHPRLRGQDQRHRDPRRARPATRGARRRHVWLGRSGFAAMHGRGHRRARGVRRCPEWAARDRPTKNSAATARLRPGVRRRRAAPSPRCSRRCRGRRSSRTAGAHRLGDRSSNGRSDSGPSVTRR